MVVLAAAVVLVRLVAAVWRRWVLAVLVVVAPLLVVVARLVVSLAVAV